MHSKFHFMVYVTMGCPSAAVSKQCRVGLNGAGSTARGLGASCDREKWVMGQVGKSHSDDKAFG